MAGRNKPAEPLLVILGSTGTGKSEVRTIPHASALSVMLTRPQLAVELATRFRGEIINSDAMQLYKGLPVITNKVNVEEQRGIPHHLLGHIDLDQDTWVVGDYKREAQKIIEDIRSRGNLPIVVGGTQYYVDKLLFDDVILDQPDSSFLSFPILDEPTEVMLAKLREVDPVMAEQWHPNDRRKIRRSLEIYLRTGRRASDIYAEQELRRTMNGNGAEGNAPSPWQSLLFWVYSDPQILKERVTKRVDRMLDNGLLDEAREMYQYLKHKHAKGEKIDLNKGIWQSIGYKQFEPYLRAKDENPEDEGTAEKLKEKGLEEMKGGTRRYSKYQTRWIRYKLIPLLQDTPNAMDHLFLVDSTDLSKWKESVIDPAASITKQFLDGSPLPSPLELSDRAREVLAAAGVAKAEQQRTPCRKVCDICSHTFLTEETWQKHMASAKHRRAKRKAKRRALVVYEPPSEDSAESDVDLEQPDGLLA